MKVGDLVKYGSLEQSRPYIGIVVGFDKDRDPIIRDIRSGEHTPHWRNRVEVISESR